MTKRFTSVLTILASLATMGVANMTTVTSAHATDTRNAYNMCVNRGPACMPLRNGDGSYDFVVENDGGTQVVHCPPGATSECSVDHPPARETTPRTLRDGLVGPTSGLAVGPVNPTPKTPVGPARSPRGFEVGRALN